MSSPVDPARTPARDASRTRAPTRRVLTRGSLIGLVVGVMVLTALVAWQGVGTIAETIARAGWGVLWLPAYFALPMSLAVGAWIMMFPREGRPPIVRLVRASWIGFGINWLLPVAQVGGEMARAEMLARRGTPAPVAIASVVGDKTIQFFAQIAFAMVGLGLLVMHGAGGEVIAAAVAGVGVLAALLVAFYAFQRYGMERTLGALTRRFGPGEGGDGADAGGRIRRIDAAVHELYGRRGRCLSAALLRLAFRTALAGEVYIAMHLLGHPVTILEAVVLESIGQSARAAAFLIPGGIGAQEGAFAVVALALGIPPELGVSVSLSKRVREVGVGLPALIVWQSNAARHVWARRARGADGAVTQVSSAGSPDLDFEP